MSNKVLTDNGLPTAELLSFSNDPIETIFYLWQKSKDADFSYTPSMIKNMMLIDEKYKNNVIDVFRKVISQKIPVAENISFTFMIHNDPISHREQMVRHRIGVHYGDNFGVDIVPDANKSSYWSQSMRIMDYSKFAKSGKFFIPESISDDPIALDVYIRTMEGIQDGYDILVNKLNIPMEDARNLLPLGSTMDISWTVNLSALQHIIGKRSCWILQYGLWGNIIKTMIDELSTKVHPIFRELVHPPCINNNKFTGCAFKLENERRIDQRDELPICPLYYQKEMDNGERQNYNMCVGDKNVKLFDKLKPKYESLWGIKVEDV